MKDLLKWMSLLPALALVPVGCASDGDAGDSGDADDRDRGSATSNNDDDRDADDENEAAVQAARDAWPAYTGGLKDLVDLSAYDVVTIVPFQNLTDNSQEGDAGRAFAEELEEYLNERHGHVYTTVRVADAALGRADEVVVRGQVYDMSKPHFSPWTGRSKFKFRAEFLLENGQTGELLKSAQIKVDSHHDDHEELMEEAAEGVARMLAKSKG